MWRHSYWYRRIDQRALNRARRRGRAGLRVEAEKVVREKLAPANPPFEGRQTRPSGNVIYYAQHATATCCRRCLEYWHGIEKGQDLTQEQITYVLGLIERFIEQRQCDLPEEGVKVPPIRKNKLATKE
jgi:hypothetical protein